jgi:hypothetical protein
MLPDQTTIDNSWIESNLGTCMDVLANMAQYVIIMRGMCSLS